MNTLSLKSRSVWRACAIDAVLLAVGCCVPTLSHLLALPLYQLNPMLFVLLAGMLLVRDRRNAYLLAVLLPVVSMLAVGMPTPMKALCMAAEYATVVFVCGRLQGKAVGYVGMVGVSVAAMLSGKVVYYLLKAFVMSPVVLVGTPVATQLVVVVAAALIYSALHVKLRL
ncbi:MAG: hypothetical protein J5641_04220 [Bacteroidales bacterium]|nr:hypothetical protein [Bacteroidales bacterium]